LNIVHYIDAMIIIEFIATVLIADFISGLVHWTEDTFWTEKTTILGRWLVQPNVQHHNNGAAFVKNNWLQSSWDLLAAGLIILAISVVFDVLTWQVCLFLLLSVNANQIHKWSHMNRNQVPLLVALLQKYRFLQTSGHHAHHHRGGKNTHYCVITDYTNPILDKAGFWRALESLLVPVFKTPRRNDIQGRQR